MGTHPIFESDFDCLTDGLRTKKIPIPKSWANQSEDDPRGY